MKVHPKYAGHGSEWQKDGGDRIQAVCCAFDFAGVPGLDFALQSNVKVESRSRINLQQFSVACDLVRKIAHGL